MELSYAEPGGFNSHNENTQTSSLEFGCGPSPPALVLRE